MSASALVCLAPGSEETEAVTTIDLLIRGGIKVTTASVASDGNLAITCSRGVKLLADAPLVEVADGEYDVIVLPGGIKGAECFRDSTLLVETVKQFHRSGRIVAAICAAPATVLVPHDIFPIGNMTGFPTLKDKIPAEQWQAIAQRTPFPQPIDHPFNIFHRPDNHPREKQYHYQTHQK
ncbi:oxidative-stress-resistance chaperone [Escherichia coli O157:H7 str. K5609]|nr:oxidative-stress-resistance chaperone [Escherichia coli O157:H7 str. K5609]